MPEVFSYKDKEKQLAFIILYVKKKKNVLRAQRGHMEWMWNTYKDRFTTNMKCKLFQRIENLKG